MLENSVAIGGALLWIICDTSFFCVYSPVNIGESINKMYVGVGAAREVHNSTVADSPGSLKDRRNFEDDSGSHFQSQVAWSVARSESA